MNAFYDALIQLRPEGGHVTIKTEHSETGESIQDASDPFPSYYRKERPDIVQYSAVQVNYRFT